MSFFSGRLFLRCRPRDLSCFFYPHRQFLFIPLVFPVIDLRLYFCSLPFSLAFRIKDWFLTCLSSLLLVYLICEALYLSHETLRRFTHVVWFSCYTIKILMWECFVYCLIKSCDIHGWAFLGRQEYVKLIAVCNLLASLYIILTKFPRTILFNLWWDCLGDETESLT